MKTLLPSVLRAINSAARHVRPDGEAASYLDYARDNIAEIAAARCAIECQVRYIQSIATRGRGMPKATLDMNLEDIVTRLRQL